MKSCFVMPTSYRRTEVTCRVGDHAHPARVLLALLAKNPKVVEETLGGAA